MNRKNEEKKDDGTVTAEEHSLRPGPKKKREEKSGRPLTAKIARMN